MIGTTSPSVQRRYPLATVCRIWGVSRATLYRQRLAPAGDEPRAAGRRGPGGAGGDADLLAAIREAIEASPFSGEGYRKVWARLRFRGVRTAARRVRRIMKAHGLLAPHRSALRAAHPHDGTIVTGQVDQIWGTDMTQTITTAEGRACVFIAVDHCSGEFVGAHAASCASRWEALEPIRQGVAKHFGMLDAGAAAGLTLRHDHWATTTARTTCRSTFSGKSSSSASPARPPSSANPRAKAWPSGRSAC